MSELHSDGRILISSESSQEQNIPKDISYFKLYRYADTKDKFMMTIGSVSAFLNGATFPIFSIIFGNMTDVFSKSNDQIIYLAGMNALYFVAMGIGTFILSFIMLSQWMISGERQGIEFRKNYFKAILKQEIGWFDKINPNELSSKVANESFSIQGAIGEKVALFINNASATFFGFLFGFVFGWQLAIVVAASLPVLSVFTTIFGHFISAREVASTKAYSDASGYSEQALNSIKTVKILDGEDYELTKYMDCLKSAAKVSIKYNIIVGISFGMVLGSLLWSYGLGLWYGSRLVANQVYNQCTGEAYNVSNVVTIFFSVLQGGYSLGQIGPCIQYFTKGKAAAINVFQILDRVPKIQNVKDPIQFLQLEGDIVIKNVSFKYPNKQDQQILTNLNLRIFNGKKIALVGESGCGKSTIAQLLERFYECDQGEIIFGGDHGINIKNYDLYELRQQIGLVGQEPVLLATSIRENLRYSKPDATEQQMIDALKRVNAWEFIEKLDNQLDTYVGIGGQQLSGGQKQRIAIARAIIKNPQILILDEATSALDKVNEKLIQDTLDKVSTGITTLVIAHRLSSIQNADFIYVIDKGQVLESGTHSQLMAKNGKYFQLVQNQTKFLEEQEIVKIESSKIELADGFEQEYEQQVSNIRGGSVFSNKQLKLNLLSNPNIINTAQDDFDKLKTLLKRDSQTIKPYKVSQEEEIDQQPQQVEQFEYRRLLKYNDHKCLLIFGALAALINGCAFPVFSLFLSKIFTILITLANQNISQQERDYQLEQADLVALWIFLIGLGSVLFWGIQNIFLSIAGERLTIKMRQETYRKLLRMPITFFDDPNNTPGALSTRLQVDCKSIQDITTSTLGINLQNVGSCICGLVIAFYSSWVLALILVVIQPLAYIGSLLNLKSVQGFSDQDDKAYYESSSLIMECVTNIRTINSIANDNIILDIYNVKVMFPLQRVKERAIKSGLGYGYSQTQTFIIYALIFYVGAQMVVNQGLEIENMFRAFFAISYASLGAGSNQALAGDIDTAKKACLNIFKLLDQEDEYQREIRLNKKKIQAQIKGNIKFQNVSFKYESRDKIILQNLSFNVREGEKAALVGPSGCGKTTIMSLLMRMYEPDQGVITIDDVDIQDYDIRFLRRQLAVVSQEPALFFGTIQDNIKYNMFGAQNAEIIEASKQAYAYDFIIKNDFDDNLLDQTVGQGFDRQVGLKGSQISGGQKQRIAIARAILRKSNLLLLDEATSALDSNNEQLVQMSLNNLMRQKTCLTIAHRISTIQDSDVIYVLNEGQIIEQGDYTSLIGRRGIFYKMEKGY